MSGIFLEKKSKGIFNFLFLYVLTDCISLETSPDEFPVYDY